jgi:hypothetical protein
VSTAQLAREVVSDKAAAKIAERLANLHFYTTRELATVVDPNPDWIWHGYLARGCMTELDGQVKLAGKTTLAFHLIRAIISNEEFLSRSTTKTNVLYLTEQQREPFLFQAHQAGLADRGDELKLLFRGDFTGIPWADLIARVAEKCVEFDAGLLVVDTIAKLAGIRNENDAGEWMLANEPLQDAIHKHHLAVLALRHDRKGGGTVTESGRGSSQGSGDPDVITRLSRPEGNTPTSRRILETEGRYSHLTPHKLIIELDQESRTYKSLGTQSSVALAEGTRYIREQWDLWIAQQELEDGATPDPLPRRVLIDNGTSHNPPIDDHAIDNAIKDLERNGTLVRHQLRGRGKPIAISLLSHPLGAELGTKDRTPTNGQLAQSREELIATLWKPSE